MMKNFFDNLIRQKLVTGISCDLSDDQQLNIDCCSIRYRKGQLDLEEYESITALNDLKKHVHSGAVVALNITGKGVLTKSLPSAGTTGDSPEELLKAAIPNSKAEDFYVQIFQGAKEHFITVIRKAEVDRLLSVLDTFGFRTVVVSLGPYVSAQMLSMLNVYEDKVFFDGYEVTRDENGQWITHRYKKGSKSGFPLKIQTTVIREQTVLPYAAALQVILSDRLSLVNAGVTSADEGLKKIILRDKLYLKTAIIAALLFILLLANLLFLTYLNKENVRLDENVQKNAQFINLSDQQEGIFRQKQSLINAAGWDGSSKSHYIDELAALKPAELSWEMIAINPPDENAYRRDRKEKFMEKTLFIEGSSNSVTAINEYLARTRILKWVKKSEMTDYRFDQERNMGFFKLCIRY